MEGGPPTGPAPNPRRPATAAAAAAVWGHPALCRWVKRPCAAPLEFGGISDAAGLPGQYVGEAARPANPSPCAPSAAARGPLPAGCGCPYSWAPGCRLCDWGDSWLQQAYASLLPKPGVPVRLSPIRPLKVAFCIPHHNVTGGLKMLLEQVNGSEQQICWMCMVSAVQCRVCGALQQQQEMAAVPSEHDRVVSHRRTFVLIYLVP